MRPKKEWSLNNEFIIFASKPRQNHGKLLAVWLISIYSEIEKYQVRISLSSKGTWLKQSNEVTRMKVFTILCHRNLTDKLARLGRAGVLKTCQRMSCSTFALCMPLFFTGSFKPERTDYWQDKRFVFLYPSFSLLWVLLLLGLPGHHDLCFHLWMWEIRTKNEQGGKIHLVGKSVAV